MQFKKDIATLKSNFTSNSKPLQVNRIGLYIVITNHLPPSVLNLNKASFEKKFPTWLFPTHPPLYVYVNIDFQTTHLPTSHSMKSTETTFWIKQKYENENTKVTDCQ